MSIYYAARRAIEQLQPVRTGYLRARRLNNGDYLVFSYRDIIATRKASGEIEFNDSKISQTTTRHQNIVREAWDLPARAE